MKTIALQSALKFAVILLALTTITACGVRGDPEAPKPRLTQN